MKMQLRITNDAGETLHEVHSDIINGIFEVKFDQGYVPEDEAGNVLTMLELGFHFVYADDIINATEVEEG